MDNKKYNVTLLHTTTSESLTNKISTLFKITPDKAQLILNKESFVIKKQTDKTTAEKFHKAITTIGANCRIDEIIENEDSVLPAIEEIVSTAQVKPLTDITQPEIPALNEEPAKLSLADGPVEKTPEGEAEKIIEEINPESFCPACGTIRASADSNCVHCGYDPQLSQDSGLKIKLFLSALLIAAIAVGVLVGWPYLQQYNKRVQIEADLTLAFDIRNQVTAFIQKTNFWPNQNIDANLNKHINNASLKSVLLSENALITVTFRADALNGKEQTLIFTPNTLKGRIVWNCLKGTLSESYRPKICRIREIPE